MHIFEMRYISRTVRGEQRPYDDKFMTVEGDFFKQLVRAGLVLEGGTYRYIKDGSLRRRMIAVTREAMSEKQMSYDARQSLAALQSLCERPPQAVHVHECVTPAHCECRKPSYLVLQSPAEWEGTPLCCGDCRKSFPLYRLIANPSEREFDDLLHWSKLRRGYVEQYMTGAETVASHEILQSCVSDLALQGRRLAGIVEVATGAITLYPLFAYYERAPERCPQCGSDWRNQYRNAVPFEFFCRTCRLVM